MGLGGESREGKVLLHSLVNMGNLRKISSATVNNKCRFLYVQWPSKCPSVNGVIQTVAVNMFSSFQQ